MCCLRGMLFNSVMSGKVDKILKKIYVDYTLVSDDEKSRMRMDGSFKCITTETRSSE